MAEIIELNGNFPFPDRGSDLQFFRVGAMLFQLIVLAILFYIVQKISRFLFQQNPKQPEAEIRGKAQSKPLDLTQSEVEDVDFKELPK